MYKKAKNDVINNQKNQPAVDDNWSLGVEVVICEQMDAAYVEGVQKG